MDEETRRIRRKQTLLSPAIIREIARFHADTFHTWQKEHWGVQGKKLSRYEYRRGFELAILEALEQVEFGPHPNTMSMSRA